MAADRSLDELASRVRWLFDQWRFESGASSGAGGAVTVLCCAAAGAKLRPRFWGSRCGSVNNQRLAKGVFAGLAELCAVLGSAMAVGWVVVRVWQSPPA